MPRRDHHSGGRPPARTWAHEFYFDRNCGRALRRVLCPKSARQLASQHAPLRSISVYVALILLFYFVTAHVTRLLLGRLDDLPILYRRLPYVLSFFIIYSVVGVLTMRIIHFIGLRTLFHLITGTYHRPVQERIVLLFLDINGSTALGERLGALSMRALVRKFLIRCLTADHRSWGRNLPLQRRRFDCGVSGPQQ